MLRDYRNWLESELKLLGNASHHAYSFGQANMAKRALEKLDELLGRAVFVPLERPLLMRVLTELELIEQQTTSTNAALGELKQALRTAFEEGP